MFGCNFFFLCVCFQTLSASDLRDLVISGRIATRMKEFHGLDMPGVKKALLWDRLRYVSFVFFYFTYYIVDSWVFVDSENGWLHARDWLHLKKPSHFVSMLWRWKLICLRSLCLRVMKRLGFATMIYSMET